MIVLKKMPSSDETTDSEDALAELNVTEDPSLMLTSQERSLLERYLPFYRALETRRRAPQTDAQRHFVAVCEGRAGAETDHEIAYVKFMRLRKKPGPSWREDWHSWFDQER
jgi:hypothetical protein